MEESIGIAFAALEILRSRANGRRYGARLTTDEEEFVIAAEPHITLLLATLLQERTQNASSNPSPGLDGDRGERAEPPRKVA